MYELILNDGTRLPALFCSARYGVLTAGVESDLSFPAFVQLFADSAKTGVITFVYGEMRDVFEDYTILFMVNGVNPGEYILSLKKEESR